MNVTEFLEYANAELQKSIAEREARLTVIWAARVVLLAAEKIDAYVAEREA